MRLLDRPCVRERSQLALALIATWAVFHAYRSTAIWLVASRFTAGDLTGITVSRTFLWTFFSALLVCFVQRYASQTMTRLRRATMFLLAVPVVAVMEAIIETALVAYPYALVEPSFWTMVQRLTVRTNLLIGGVAVLVAHIAFARQQAAQRRQQQLELEAELASMQADQICERFRAPGLHSMIESIHDAAATDPVKAKQLLTELAQLLRLAMELDAKPEVHLQDELDFADRYAALRRPDIPLRIRADLAALQVLIPPRIVPSFVDGLVSTSTGAVDLHISVEHDLHVSAANVAADGSVVVSNLRLPLS